jgi:anti-sigma28 factor (negative regulator of flagellin synthesis)
MDRRELLKMIAALTGGVVIGGEVFLTGCKSNDAGVNNSFSKDDIGFLDEVGETIIPRTETPGAKDAAVGQFMTVIVNDCYEPQDQQAFHAGIKQLDEACEKMYSKGFMKATPEERTNLLVTIDQEARKYHEKKSAFDKEQIEKLKAEIVTGNKEYKKETMAAHYFTMMKQLALLGFFTSKPGATQVLRYVPVPQKYEGCVPYKKGDRAFI